MKKSNIKDLIAKGDTEAALEAFRQLAIGAPLENEVALLSGRFQKVQREMLLGTVNETAGRQEINQINFALLELLGSAIGESSPTLPTVKIKKWIWVAAALVVVGVAGIYFFKKRSAALPQTFEFQYVQKNLPVRLVSKIDSLQKAGEMVTYLSLGPEDRDWVVFYGRNKFLHNGNLSGYLTRKLDSLSRLDDVELKGLYLGKYSSFIAWFDANNFWFYFDSHYPSAMKPLTDTMFLYYRQNREIRDLAVAPDGSWVILWGQSGYTYRAEGDASFPNVLKDLNMGQAGRLKQFSFSQRDAGEWVLLHDANGFDCGSIDSGLKNELEKLRREGHEILKVFMRRSNEWTVFFK